MLEHRILNRVLNRMPLWLRHLYLLLTMLFGMLLFRSLNMAQIGSMVSALFHPAAGDLFQHPLLRYMTNDIWVAFAVGIIGSSPVFHKIKPPPASIRFLAYAVLFLLSCAFVAGQSFSPFLYFRF